MSNASCPLSAFPTFRISNDPVQAGQIRTRRNLVAGKVTV